MECFRVKGILMHPNNLIAPLWKIKNKFDRRVKPILPERKPNKSGIF